MSISTRENFIEYCLRKLGSPIVEINIDPDQIEDRIDEAIEYFRLYHWDGIERVFLKYKVTETDAANRYITLPDYIYGINKVYNTASGTSASKSIFDLQYQLRLNDLYDLTSTSIIYYSQVMSHLQLLDTILNGQKIYNFNRLNGKLIIETNWTQNIGVNSYILIECYRALDPATAPLIWNDIWLKHYATALLKKQWGANIKKFDGMQLPGGITVDGKSLWNEAVEEIEALEDELKNKQAPLGIFIG